jgi:ATP-dependent Lon protease
MDREPIPGLALGLAWTEVGGEILPVESSTMPGEGKLTLTGQLGEVLQESAKAALSYIRAHAQELSADPEFHKKLDLHVHIAEGAIPKDGPSAGVALVVSLASALSGRPIAQDVAMTGEITLRGKVLKIGGLKEKAIAAHRAKIKRLILPEENRDDLEELPDEVKNDLHFIFIDWVGQALAAALMSVEEFPEKPIWAAGEIRQKESPHPKNALRRRAPRRQPPALPTQ